MGFIKHMSFFRALDTRLIGCRSGILDLGKKSSPFVTIPRRRVSIPASCSSDAPSTENATSNKRQESMMNQVKRMVPSGTSTYEKHLSIRGWSFVPWQMLYQCAPSYANKFATTMLHIGGPYVETSKRLFSTRNIRGRLFYRRRPKMIPRYKPKNRRSCWLEGCPQKKGVCIAIRVVTPRKPNSGLRKIARVRLSTGRTVTCHIPGEGHNLHTHSVVLVRGGRCQDVSGCHYKVIRGKYDLLPVKNRASSRSKYGVRLTDAIVEKRRTKLNRLHVTTDLDREVFNRLMLHDWVNPDGTRRTEPVGPDEAVPMDIFSFNSRLRSIVHSSSKA